MVSADEFNEAWQNIQKGDLFQLDITDTALMVGWKPERKPEDEQDIFGSILVSSMAHRFLKAAWDFDELQYVVCINNILVGFHTSFGWSFLTPNSYIAGNVPKGWQDIREQGRKLLVNLLDDNAGGEAR